MGSVSQTPAMMISKISLLILGLVFIGSSFAISYPNINGFFPSYRTTYRGFGNVEEPSMSFKSHGESNSMDENLFKENLIKSMIKIFPERRFFVKRAAPDTRFDDFAATRG